MKKIYTIIIIALSLNSFSQKDYSRYYNSWRLGLNVGGAWQTADVRSCWGMAGGITLEKGFHENATNIFSFAIRGRYLGANTYGMDYNRNYNIKTNDAYNGTYNPTVNYQADTATKARGYVYDNYKMTLNEGSIELQMTFNKLREKTHILFNIWAGIGITSYRTNTDLLDANGVRYDFSKIDSTGNQSTIINSYNLLIDKKYESYALGSKNGNLITFSPSGGFGLGYQFSPGFSMIWEYKMTFPQGPNSDLLDGKIGSNKDWLGCNKDYYHYTGINFFFNLRGKPKTTTPRDETVYTNVNTSNTVTAVNNTINTNTVITSSTTPTVIPEQKPIITYITPPSNGQVSNTPAYKISAQILNISNANQIKFYYNTALITNFTYNSQTHVLEFDGNLNIGTNYIQIIATNTAGSDNKSTTVIYEKVPVQTNGNPPTIDIKNPNNCPYIAQDAQINIAAICTHVTSKNNIIVKINNISSTNFNYNLTTGQITIPLNLVNGNNNIVISVSNNFGSDVVSCNIGYTAPVVSVALPIISIINPPQSNYVSVNQTYTVNAQVINVVGSGNISVYYNGVSTAFNYNSTTKKLIFTVSLNEGVNTIAINAYNSAGDDNKSTSIIYHAPIVLGNPPIVNLISPTQINGNNAAAPLYNYNLSILNINSKSDISLVFNGNSSTNFNFNTITKALDFNGNLNIGSNSLTVKGTNAFGFDSKTIYVDYQPRIAQKSPPKIIFNAPSISPANAKNSNYNYIATITNVPSNAGLVVKYNGIIITNYSYNGLNLTYNATLNTGNNVLEITATNNDGSDLASAIVNFTPKSNPTPPIVSLVNPASVNNATDNLLYNFGLTVLNVSTINDIEVTFNGSIQTNFTYDNITKMVNFSSNLEVGNNSLTVKGTNQYGFDYKTVYVTYTPHADIKLPPIVTFVNPLVSPALSANNNYTYKATIGNMPTNSGITVTYNGNVVTNYTYDGYNLDFNTILNSGFNTLDINAINNDGNDSKTATVNYKQKIVPHPPVVSIITPINNPTVTTMPYVFNFSATNVIQNQISITLNGNPVSSFSFIGNTGSFTENLMKGKTTLIVTATNNDGSDSKAESVYFEPVSNATISPSGTNSTSTSGNVFSTMTICHTQPGSNLPGQTISIPNAAWPLHQAHGDTQGACPVQKINSDSTGNQTPIIPNIKKPMINSKDTTKNINESNNRSRPR